MGGGNIVCKRTFIGDWKSFFKRAFHEIASNQRTKIQLTPILW
jgi:hypothetical protein